MDRYFNELSQNYFNWQKFNTFLEWNRETYQLRPWGTDKPLEGIMFNPLLGIIKYEELDDKELEGITLGYIQDYVNKHGYVYIPTLGNYIVGDVDVTKYQQDEDPDLVQPEEEQEQSLYAYDLIDPEDPNYDGENTKPITKGDGYVI